MPVAWASDLSQADCPVLSHGAGVDLASASSVASAHSGPLAHLKPSALSP